MTRPGECRHPTRYSSVDKYATEDQVTRLIAAFVTALQPDYVLETGAYHGHTSEAIGMALARAGQGRLDTLEVNEERARIAQARVADLPVTVHAISTAKFTPDGVIDLAFIDEAIPERGRTLQRYRQYFRPGSVILVHDTNQRYGTAHERDQHGVGHRVDTPVPAGYQYGRGSVHGRGGGGRQYGRRVGPYRLGQCDDHVLPSAPCRR